MSDIEDDDLVLGSIFTEPPRPPTPEPTITTFVRDTVNIHHVDDWTEIKIRLVGTHPLWGHYLWNAARAFASYLDARPEQYVGLSVLELGAGGALPSIVSALNGANKVVISDYPDADLVDNMEYNVRENVPSNILNLVKVQGYVWGQAVEPLLKNISTEGFDLIILSDLVFNHSQHEALLKTCELSLSKHSNVRVSNHLTTTLLPSPPPSLLVFYSHHRPHFADRDMEFFSKARTRGWACNEILTMKYPAMFPKDSGDETVRSTVHGWKLTRAVP